MNVQCGSGKPGCLGGRERTEKQQRGEMGKERERETECRCSDMKEENEGMNISEE